MGEQEQETWVALPQRTFDVVIMNPPFTRATGHHDMNDQGVPNPIFAAFGATDDEQEEMAAAEKLLTRGTCADGNAGEGTFFLALANRKLRIGGTVALVLPVSLVAGKAWEKCRELLRKRYSNLIVASISGVEGAELSFSADTHMGECLVIGRRDPEPEIERKRDDERRATFVILRVRPATSLVGETTAKQIRQLIEEGNLRRLEDGPVGGSPLYFGDDEIGQILDAPIPSSGGWNVSRVADLALAQSAYQLANRSRIWLPTMRESAAMDIPITTVGTIGEIGPIDRDIDGEGNNGAIRGPFTIVDLRPGSRPTYPALWSHDAEIATTMSFAGDCEAQPRRSRSKAKQEIIDEKVERVWDTASHAHFSKELRFNSQCLAMQFTPHRTIGGRSWPSIKLPKAAHEKALVLWANSSLGLLMYWWHSNKQQSGRGYIAKTALQSMPVLDVTALEPAQLDKATEIFDAMRGKTLRPVHEMDSDPVRKEIDTRLAREVLGLSASILAPLKLLRRKLAAEPSVLGAKSDDDDDDSVDDE